MSTTTNTTFVPPKVPASKDAHKQSLFDSFRDLIGVALAYTINYRNDSDERNFIDFLEDVIKALPLDEQSVPICASVFYLILTPYTSD
jgi:hypothetical protein